MIPCQTTEKNIKSIEVVKNTTYFHIIIFLKNIFVSVYFICVFHYFGHHGRSVVQIFNPFSPLNILTQQPFWSKNVRTLGVLRYGLGSGLPPLNIELQQDDRTVCCGHNTVKRKATIYIYCTRASMLPATFLGQLLIEISAAGPYYPTSRPLQLELLALCPTLSNTHQQCEFDYFSLLSPGAFVLLKQIKQWTDNVELQYFMFLLLLVTVVFVLAPGVCV